MRTRRATADRPAHRRDRAAATRRSCSRPSPASTIDVRALRATARAFAAALAARGIAPGETVSFMLPNGIERRDACSSARCTAATSCRRSTCSRRTRSSRYTLAHSETRVVFASRGELVERARGDRAHAGGARSTIVRSSAPTGSSCRGAQRRAACRRCRDRAIAGDADVHVGHDRARRRARCCRTRTCSHAGRAVARVARADARRSRAVVAAALSHQRPVHRDGRAARARAAAS